MNSFTKARTFNLSLAIITSTLVLSLSSCSPYPERETPTSQRKSYSALKLPNIIFVVADDMGVRDTAYTGNPIAKTPNLDLMAKAGLHFNQFYSAHATCSPGRMAILTGRTPLRARMFRTVGPMQAGEVTVAKALKSAGYATAHFGKWGLGRRETHPLNVGFDKAIWARGHFNNGAKFHVDFSNKSDFDPNVEDEWPVTTTGDSSVAIMNIAMDFITEQADQDRPFFAQVCFGSPHGAHIPHEDYRKLYSDREKSEQNYYGEISGLDAAVGILRRELRSLGIEKNTLVWFVSDNGGVREDSGGKTKGNIGVRTTGLIEWPGIITANSLSDIPVSHMDMYPTILDITGVNLDHQPVVDGISILPLLEGTMHRRPQPIGFTRGGNPDGSKECKLGDAVWIDGSLKLRLTPARKGRPEKITLHDIYRDPKETHDLAAEHPDQVEAMLKAMAVWRRSVQNSYAGNDYLEK